MEGGKEVSLWILEDSCLLRFEQGFDEEEKKELHWDLVSLLGGSRDGDFVEVKGGEYSVMNLRGMLRVKGIKVSESSKEPARARGSLSPLNKRKVQ